jgi:hypothetical protein
MQAKVARNLFIALALAVAGSAAAGGHRGGMHYDGRYNHGRSYPSHGHVYSALPRGYVNVHYHGSPYYYRGGIWYRPHGPRYVVVAPPIGIGVGFLPPYYTTVWFGGVPYYYADQAYYLWRPERREYVVTRPPAGQPAQVGDTSSGSADVFVYPKNGQSEAQQSTDRYECHAWAVQKSGFDPTKPGGGVAQGDIETRRADYRRAEAACLDGRGYSVK